MRRLARTTFAVALLLIATLGVGWQVRAETERALLGFGANLMQYAPSGGSAGDHQSAPLALRFNGALTTISHGATRASVTEVLDAFATKCTRAQATTGGFSELDTRVRQALRDVGFRDGVFRAERANEGAVLCFEPDTRSDTPFAKRLSRALQSGDPAELGELRYVRVERASASARTVFLTIATEGPLDVRAMFPARGDAPGNDLAGVPRPTGAQRILSLEPQGPRAQLVSYRVASGEPRTLVRSFATQLRRAGYEPIETGAAPQAQAMLLFRKAEQLLTLTVRPREGGGALATLLMHQDSSEEHRGP